MLAQTKEFIDPITWRKLQLISEPPPPELLRAAPIDLSKLFTWPAQPVVEPGKSANPSLTDWLRQHQVAIAVGAAALFLLAVLKALAR